ncbi:hypothetical protein K438DRAFT_2115246 [Mycena galopus ATCC 62051]|nr:hypothetical protein K438DRAFT_2115246 [Mycena galopus ATCC 62051]
MPTQPTCIQIRKENIIACLTVVADTLEVLAGGLNTPFSVVISNIIQSMLKNMVVKSDTGGVPPPSVLNQIGKFTETLRKIHTFIEAQQSGSKVKQFFRQGEMSALFKDCKNGLTPGLDFFQLRNSGIMTDISKMRAEAKQRHQEVLVMINGLSDTASSDGASMLLGMKAPRIAILGTGGMGKTSLARVVLHHAQVSAKYTEHRYFVACDSATNKIELAALIGMHLGLKPGKYITGAVVKFFTARIPSLLILNNLETVWEPADCRRDIEEFLFLLTDVEHLALIITMRGAERPAKVQWTRPFLPPLSPLEYDAARQTFIDIAEDHHNPADVNWMWRDVPVYYPAGRWRKHL